MNSYFAMNSNCSISISFQKEFSYVPWQDINSHSTDPFEIHIPVDDLVQDCSISTANTPEILQSCNKPSMYPGGPNQYKDVILPV